MNPVIGFLKRHSLISGLVLMFLISWPFAMADSGLIPVRLPFALSVTYGWALSIAALILTGLTLGRAGVIALLKRFLIWRVSIKWYLVAFLLTPAIFTSAVMLNAALTHTPADFSGVFAHKIFGASASLPVFILPFFLFDLLTNGEELAWRGFALPRLQARYSALISSLILGVIWAFWHFPRYLAPTNTASFPLLLVKVVAEAVIYTWLYNSTRGSLLLTSLMHAAGNTAGAFLPVANTLSSAGLGPYLIVIAIDILIAVAIVVAFGPARLADQAQTSPV